MRVLAAVGLTLLICFMGFGFFVYYFTEPYEPEDETLYCAWGVNETSGECMPDPGPDCFTETYTDPETNETYEEEYCVDMMVDAQPYTVDGGPPEFRVPGTNIAYPVPLWASHLLAGMVLFKTGGGALHTLRNLTSRKKDAKATKRKR